LKSFKPLLAYTIQDLFKIRFPVICSSKIDGIRCIVSEGKALSRSLKQIPNKHIQQKLSEMSEKFEGLMFDGELIVGSNFQETTSAVMSVEGTPEFTFLIFDLVTDGEFGLEFQYRVGRLTEMSKKLPSFCKVLYQKTIIDVKELIDFYDTQVELGFEGAIVRSPDKGYKFGRSTEKEGIIGKIKPYADDEFEVIGVETYFGNENESEVNELGYKKKSSRKEGKVMTEKLGAFVCKHPLGSFNVGSGLTLEQREEFWKIKESLIGKKVKVKYMSFGIKDLPRHPVFLGFRSDDDT